MTFAQPDALQVSLISALRMARPTEFLGVPRVYEKFEEMIKQQANNNSNIYKSLFNWARDRGKLNTVA